MKFLFTLFSALLLTSAYAQVLQNPREWDIPQSYKPMRSSGTLAGAIPPLRTLTPQTTPIMRGGKTWTKRNYFKANDLNNPNPQPQNGDPLFKEQPQTRKLSPQLRTNLNIDGIGDLSGITPPDPVGDVGKNHYIQMVNAAGGSWFQIWDKQGNSVYGPALTSTIWSQVGLGSIGDPIVQYDHAAQRWLMMEMQDFGVNQLLMAISNTSDPTDGWKAYVFSTLGFPDYPKLYVWNNAYFVTANEIVNGNTCAGFALERDAILNGAPSFQVHRFQMPNYLGIQYQPATGVDWEMGAAPPPGTPGYIMRVYDDAWNGGVDQLQMWEVRPNWSDPDLSTLTGPIQLFPAPFETKVCYSGLFDCIDQPQPANNRITALENIIMYRAPYQNFGDHESIVLNHVADVSGIVGPGGDAQVRWYELRRTGNSPWSIYQQGTYGADKTTNRFTGTLSMDALGNVALGYTVTSETNVFPGLRLTGRRSGDPLGEMTISEYVLKEGEALHNDQRWGDYSNMAVDPEDGRTFWYTGEYQPGSGNWATRIGNFQIERDTYDVTPIALMEPKPSNMLGSSEYVKARIFNNGLDTASNFQITLFLDGNLVVSNSIAAKVAPGGNVDHVFTTPVNLQTLGKYYNFVIVTSWGLDNFSRNDTLRAQVRHLTSNDAQAAGRANFPGVICGTDYNLEFILKNAGADSLKSAIIQWKVNSQNYQSLNWNGQLESGAQDTILIPLSGLVEGVNFFYANTVLPNGLSDEDVHNDSIFFKFNGNVDGAYLEARANSQFGVLKIELRKQNNALLAAREFPGSGIFSIPLCTDDVTCYKLILKSGTLAWEGDFNLYDIFGNVLVHASSADPMEQVFSFCTPSRKQNDMGAVALLKPQSSTDLGASEPVSILFRNFGKKDQNNVPVAYRVNGGSWKNGVLTGVSSSGENIPYTFPETADLSIPNKDYLFEFKTLLPGDETPDNDQKTTIVQHRYAYDLSLDSLLIGDFCADTFGVIHIRVQNRGTQMVDSFQVASLLNGLNSTSLAFSGALMQGDVQEYNIPLEGLKQGDNVLKLYLNRVQNGVVDQFPQNDTISGQIYIDSSKNLVTIVVFTDDHPEQTRYEVLDPSGQLVYSRGPLSFPFNYDYAPLCLDKNKCYKLRLKDSAVDGFFGFIQVISPDFGALADYYGGNFGSSLDLPFCTVSPCLGFSLLPQTYPPSGGGVADGKIKLFVQGGNPPFQFSLDGTNYQTDSIFSNLAAGVYTIFCQDAKLCNTTVAVNLELVGTQAPLDGDRKLHVSPNPSANLVWVALPATDQERNAQAWVSDAQGRVINHFKLDRWDEQLRGVFSLEKQAAGIYWLRVQTGKQTFAARIVKN